MFIDDEDNFSINSSTELTTVAAPPTVLEEVNQDALLKKEKQSLKESLIPTLSRIIDNISSIEEIEALKNMIAPIELTLAAMRNEKQ